MASTEERRWVKRLLRLTPALGVALGITLVSAIPGQKIGPMPFEGFDKLVHFGFFATLSTALAFGIGRQRWARQGAWMVLLVVAAVAVLGALDEWHQSFVPLRSPTWGDWATDVATALVVALAFWKIGRRSAGLTSDNGRRPREASER